jgi:hypothetical protein
MQNDIKWSIWEAISYIVLRYLWFNINKPFTGSDDKWDDLNFRKKINWKTYSFYVQVKTTENLENWKFNLEVKNYNDYAQLNNENTINKWIILVVKVDKEKILSITEENFTTYCKLFWYKPSWELTSNTSTISIPIEQNQINDNNLNNILNQWIQ